MDSWPMMAQAAARFAVLLRAAPGAQRIPVEAAAGAGLEWDNLLLESAEFRHGHVEILRAPGRLSVLHVCIFPHLDDPRPIFGFDMVAGPARVTGIFLDFSASSTVPSVRLRDAMPPGTREAFSCTRDLPAWGSVFSADMVAVRPVDEPEIERAIRLGVHALEAWLGFRGARAAALRHEIMAGQARYIAAQRRNQHTFRMLAGFIGAEAARRFIDEVLFPAVPHCVNLDEALVAHKT